VRPAPFDYVAPRTVDEALDLLARHGDEAKVLAGGQSLVPMMNMRLVRPAVVVDLNRVATLGEASLLHAGRPTVVTVGVGAAAVTGESTRSGDATLIKGRARPVSSL